MNIRIGGVVTAIVETVPHEDKGFLMVNPPGRNGRYGRHEDLINRDLFGLHVHDKLTAPQERVPNELASSQSDGGISVSHLCGCVVMVELSCRRSGCVEEKFAVKRMHKSLKSVSPVSGWCVVGAGPGHFGKM